MSEFNVRADSVNVEQIMDQIRARIRDKRGVDYTEDQIRELATVKLEKFLDPRGIRSDLLEQFRKSQPPVAQVTLYPFEDTTLFDSHRGIVRLLRRLFRPLVKLFFNSNALAQSLHQQTIINRQTVDRLNAIDQRGDLYYELLHNLVLELTRATVEVKNMAMRVESISSRLEFNERRARALESVVVYKPAEAEREARPATAVTPASTPQRGGGAPPRDSQRYTPPPTAPRPPTPSPVPASPAATAPPANGSPDGVPTPASGEAGAPGEGPGQRSRRRRRRRGRRGGAAAAAVMGAIGQPSASATPAETTSTAESSATAFSSPDAEPRTAETRDTHADAPSPAPSPAGPPSSSEAHDDDDDQ